MAEGLKPLPACMVAGFGGLGGCMAYQVAEVFAQRMVRMPGVLVAARFACGAKEKKRVSCCRDSASAISLCFPGRC